MAPHERKVLVAGVWVLAGIFVLLFGGSVIALMLCHVLLTPSGMVLNNATLQRDEQIGWFVILPLSVLPGLCVLYIAKSKWRSARNHQ